MNELEYYHDDLMADTYLRADQIETYENLALWDEPYALLVGKNTSMIDGFGELGQQGSTIYHFFDENNCLVSLTKAGLSEAAKKFKGLDLQFDQWLSEIEKLNWPEKSSHEGLTNIGYAVPKLIAKKDTELTSFIKHSRFWQDNMFEVK